jgi:hypothetical protein
MVEDFHETVLTEFCRVVFRKEIYPSIDELRRDPDTYFVQDNAARPHQGQW